MPYTPRLLEQDIMEELMSFEEVKKVTQFGVKQKVSARQKSTNGPGRYNNIAQQD